MADKTSEPTQAQTQQEYNALPAEQKAKQTYTEWLKENYNYQYERWMPWLEDIYLKWFGKDNKASYVTKDTLDKTKVTGIAQVDQLQDDVHSLVANQVGPNGLLAPIGNMVSKEGINRMERGGKDEQGSYGGPLGGYGDSVVEGGKSVAGAVGGGGQKVGETVVGAGKGVGEGVVGGVKGAGGMLGGLWGGKK